MTGNIGEDRGGSAPGEQPSLERRLYRLLTLVGAILAFGVIIPSNRLQGLSIWIDVAVAIAGAASLLLYLWARKGRYHPAALYFILIAALNGTWFSNGGSEGSIGQYFPLAVLLLFVFFRGRPRAVLLGLLLANGLAVLWAERAFPWLVIPFETPLTRLADLSAGFVITTVTAVLILGMLVSSFDRERDQLTTLNRQLAASLSDIQRAEAHQKQLEAQLLEARQLELVGRLAGGVAHDFNNLLTVIGGNMALALGDLEANHPAAEALREAGQASTTAADLTRQLLAFSRKQLVVPRVIAVNEALGALEGTLQSLIGGRIALQLALDPASGRVRIDPGQLDQIVVNLSVNARDAMPDGGSLSLATGRRSLDDAFCRQHLDTRPGEHVMISVTDTGAGMTPEVRARIFEPFFSTKTRGRGTGLGLATVYGMVKQNHGAIEVSSTPGAGSRFVVYLPAAEDGTGLSPARDGEVS